MAVSSDDEGTRASREPEDDVPATKPEGSRVRASGPAGPAGEAEASPDSVTPTAVLAERPPTAGTPYARARDGGLPRFAPGEVVADRYEVVRFIAHGGMGEVYEVEDRILHGRVALKTILPDIGADPTAVERFKREIQLARKVTHPSVCRIYDLGTHRVGAGADETGARILFLTMELLSGRSLSDRIKDGRLHPPEALPIVSQMAAGLQAAHDAGIVHRDFKSANVFLADPSSLGGPPRVVVTDFGLARSVIPGTDGTTTLSEKGIAVGTPAYMAPEQVEGKPVGPAADVYALGVVLFEMMTGTRPFEGGSPFGSAVRRLLEPPPRPSARAPDLDPRWESVILRCLARDPSERFLRPGDVVTALGSRDEGQVTTALSRPASRSAGPPRRKIRMAATVLFLVAAAGVVAVAVRSRVVAPPKGAVPVPRPAPVAVRRSAAVLALRNASGTADLGWLSTALSELLSTELGSGDALRVVPGQEASRAAREQGAGEADGLDRQAIARVARIAGADLLVLGSYALYGEGEAKLVRVDVHAREAATGNLLASAGATGTHRQLFDVASRVGSDLRHKLGLKDLTPAQALEVEASLPADPAAARLYSEGLARLRLFDAVGARDALVKAVAAAPKHPLPRMALSGAWLALGYEAKAREEAARAAALSGSLPERERLSLQARVHEVGRQWDRAAGTLDALLRRYPDDVEAGVRLAEARTEAGKAKASLVTIEALRELPASISDDPRLDLAEARAFQALGDFRKEAELAAVAARKARERGAGLVLARARLVEATAFLGLGERAKASEATEEARSLYHAAGDEAGGARATEQLAGALYREGDLEGCRRLYERALAVFRGVGDRGSEARVSTNLATILREQGHPKESAALLDRALATFREIGAKYEQAFALNAAGAQLYLGGDVDGAVRRYQQALEAFGELGERRETSVVLGNLGEVLLARGKLGQARPVLEEALATSRELGDKGGAAFATRLVGELLALRCDLAVARERLDEAVRLQEAAGEKGAASETRLVLARVWAREGMPAEAERLAREAEQRLRTEGSVDRAREAAAVQAEALVGLGRLAEAGEALASARQASTSSRDPRSEAMLAIAHARLAAATGQGGPASRAGPVVDAAAQEAQRLGFVPLALEARLAAAELRLALGRRETALRQLDAIAAEAKSLELLCLSRRAAARADRTRRARPSPTAGG